MAYRGNYEGRDNFSNSRSRGRGRGRGRGDSRESRGAHGFSSRSNIPSQSNRRNDYRNVGERENTRNLLNSDNALNFPNNNVRGMNTNSRRSNNVNSRRLTPNDEGYIQRKPPLSFYETTSLLNKMLDSQYSENIPLKLLDPNVRFQNFLNNKQGLDTQLCKIVIKVLLKANENEMMKKNFTELLTSVLRTQFSEKGLDRIISIDLFQNFDVEMLILLIKYLKLNFEIIPGIAYDVFYNRIFNLKYLIENRQLNSNDITAEIVSNFEELNELTKVSEIPQPRQATNSRIRVFNESDPPDDYKNISIFPSSHDLIEISTKDVFLRRNKAEGAYASVSHYLDVQFRLMREDFIQPLREGLNDYKSHDKKKYTNIRVYNKVHLLNSLPAERLGIIYNLRFDKSRLKKVNWMQSKRFLYGSLLCLSSDNFKTLKFATIANRDTRDLENGIISVKFYDSKPSKDEEYVLIETANMFESYKHVLLKLQETNEDNLCMKQYLVYAENEIALPGYLIRNKNLLYEFKSKKIWPGDSSMEWPRGVELDLDESQFQAFKSALTKELSIIQGPPGTGKTHLGLNICECLLKNVQTKIVGFGPILIVCYTNHALDQFLEGISKFTDKIVRIGNRCKSEILQQFSILNWKKKCPSKEYSRQKWDIFRKLKDFKDELLQKQALLKLSEDRLLPLERLKVFIDEDHFNYLKKVGLKNWLFGDSFVDETDVVTTFYKTIIEWLMYEEIIQNVHQIVIDAQTELLKDNEYLYENDMDNEVNYINNQRKLDIDDEDIGNLIDEFDRLVRLQEEPEEILSNDNDGFTLVRNKTTKRLFESRLRKKNKMSREEAKEIISLDLLSIDRRWNLYRYWRSDYTDYLQNSSVNIENEYEQISKQLNEIHFEEDRSVMSDQNIIGMTTTGAARYSKVLSSIRCKIIIVEEAAEVLESHIVGSLNRGCEHLILIGDHKQLKPNPAVFELSKKYELDLSLFERLINNKLGYNTLLHQHRMRPEIAEIMKFIYNDLQNHESVLNYPNVPSVSKNLYFINHSEQEKCTEDILSYSNPYEAEYVIKFCRHLMKNGVEKTQMTILTLYSGQMFLLRKLMDRNIFEGVRVCVVDNYQGEENDIILLSLVRSNAQQNIGFLNIENRICVCLSRAKHGLYVFGNFQILTERNDKWKQICQYLKRMDMFGTDLTLSCQNHPEKRLLISNPSDFDKYPEGGCEELCNQRLNCGHACRKSCHFLDKNHENNKCMERCTRLCVNGHRCELKCWQKCQECYKRVEKIIPGCNHLQWMKCYKEPKENDCENKCERMLLCGHTCLGVCKDKCGRCREKVEKVSVECKHSGLYECSDLEIKCTKKCNLRLGCDHQCLGTCGRCYMGRLHETCQSNCSAQLICGHACTVKCSFHCPPCPRQCEEGCIHNACPNKCGDSCIPCYEKCKWRCKHMKCNKLCHEICDRNVCDESCDKELECQQCKKKFKCYGVCGEPCYRMCEACAPEIKEIFFGTEDDVDAKFITLWTCLHSFEVTAMDNYMNLIADNGEIVAKKCPRCNTIINKRSCFRYLNIVKKISLNIKEVQNRIITNLETVNESDYLKKLDCRGRKILKMVRYFKVENYFDSDKKLSKYALLSFSTSFDLFYEIYKRCFSKDMRIDSDYIEKCIYNLIMWLNPNKRKFNDFEINQFSAEFDRIDMLLKVNQEIRRNPLKELNEFFEELKQVILTKETAKDFKSRWDDIYKNKLFLPNMEITEYQRKEIVKAIGLEKGRWFKCANGHFYVIGECGGANQVSKCPECHTNIGGTGHRLLNDNRFAPEMDNADGPAWPGMNNNAI